MKHWIRLAAIVMVFAALFCVLTACGQAENQAENPPKYTLYCGLNDADTGTQVLTLEEAQELARGIIISKGCGYTEFVAYGAYESEGELIGNDTLVYEILYADTATIEELAAELQAELNLMPILMEEGSSVYHFSE